MLDINKIILDGNRKIFNKEVCSMIKHFIVMASAYSIGKRIALDYFEEDILQMDVIQKDIDYILRKCGKDAPISTHFIQIDESGWDKVCQFDKFFEKAELIDSKEKFAEILLKDKTLKGIDVAKYILTKIPCTHLKLEKLVYMCYADYLCEVGSKLFEDKIYAYRYGPVIESVYKKYKKSGYDCLEVEDNTFTYDETEKKMPSRSRILSSEDGLKKLISIDKTLEKYAKYSASELVDMTHKEQTPWSQAGAGSLTYKIIEDTLIKKYHKYEEV